MAVAFHIGATHSRVAVYRDKDDRAETIVAECGNRLIKSYVNFSGLSTPLRLGVAFD